jgi:quinol monooxygenase YgiN
MGEPGFQVPGKWRSLRAKPPASTRFETIQSNAKVTAQKASVSRGSKGGPRTGRGMKVGRVSMNVLGGALIAAAIVAAAPAALAQADNQSAFGVTYIEVTPSAEAQAATLLRRVAATSRKEAGNLRYDVLQDVERPNQFAILETWNDVKAYETHGGGASMKQFRAELTPFRTGHYDERLDNGIDVGTAGAPASKDAIYVITHVDVTGQFKDDAIVMMKKLAAESRREPGVERFDIWQQSNRLNHFTTVEVWKDKPALDAHGLVASTRDFRENVGRMLGALYDDRRYKNLE